MSTYEISKSSLLSLKAEILKKQQELQKTKAENKTKLLREVKKTPLELKNRGVESRAAGDGGDAVDEDLLRKSRQALEAKSKLYEKLSHGSKNDVEKEYNRRYLVHFDKKASNELEEPDKYPQEDSEDESNLYNIENMYAAENSDDEWVEYVDGFGRTRTCLQKDLQSFTQKDKGMQPKPQETTHVARESKSDETVEIAEESQEKSELVSGDMRREHLRRQWEADEEQIRDKSDMHYQDVLFNEARTHGVGYYGFSKDEETRARQQEALNTLRKDTEAQQKRAQAIKDSRGKQLRARVRAAKNRKRAREGLPPLTSDDDAEEEKLNKDKAQVEEETKTESQVKEVSLEDRRKEEERKLHVRPWDIGKEGVGVQEARVQSGTRDPYNQTEWNDIQRSKRDCEFAPPSAYYQATSSSASSARKTHTRKAPTAFTNPYKGASFIHNECSDSDDDDDSSPDELLKDYALSRAGVNVPPPSMYNFPQQSFNNNKAKRTKHDGNMEDAIMQGLRFLREQVEKKN